MSVIVWPDTRNQDVPAWRLEILLLLTKETDLQFWAWYQMWDDPPLRLPVCKVQSADSVVLYRLAMCSTSQIELGRAQQLRSSRITFQEGGGTETCFFNALRFNPIVVDVTCRSMKAGREQQTARRGQTRQASCPEEFCRGSCVRQRRGVLHKHSYIATS